MPLRRSSSPSAHPFQPCGNDLIVESIDLDIVVKVNVFDGRLSGDVHRFYLTGHSQRALAFLLLQ